MNQSFDEEEVNYWPSISDMFLVFFVLALTLVATSTQLAEKGDKYAMTDVLSECNRLFAMNGMPEVTVSAEPDDPTKEQIERQLKEIQTTLEKEAIVHRPLPRGDEPPTKEPYRLAIHDLARTVGIEDWHLPRYDKLMRDINGKLLTQGDGLGKALSDREWLQTLDTRISATAGIQPAPPAAGTTILRSHILEALSRLDKKIQGQTEDDKIIRDLIVNLREILAEGAGSNGSLPNGTPTAQMEALVCRLVNQLDETRVELKNARPVKTVIDDRILYFETNKSIPIIRKGKEREYARAMQDVEKTAQELIDQKRHVTIEIYGHTDDSFTYDRDGKMYNAWLGLERARAMQEKIRNDCHFAGKDVTFHAYSASYHIKRGKTQADCRRIEVRILPADDEQTEE